MALEIGDIKASSGMSKAIFDELNKLSLEAPLKDMKAEDLEKVRNGWKKLAFAIATGVINHIKSNMEISGIQATGSVTGKVSGTDVTGTASTTQSGSTTGHVT